MLVPPPVSGQTYPTSFTSEERANYLRGGVTFNTAYSDNVLGATSPAPVSDVSYSVWPTIALDETTSRLHSVLTYAPGFTFYQRTSSRTRPTRMRYRFAYRLSPHVTFSARDGFQKTSNVFNQPDLGFAGTVSGGTQVPNDSVIAPIADRLSNNGNVGITYQFGANQMMGASGTFTNLHYPEAAEVPGSSIRASRAGRPSTAAHREETLYRCELPVSAVAVVSDWQPNETQTHAVIFFYTLYASPRASISVFGGPQWSDTVRAFLPLTAALAEAGPRRRAPA